LDQTRREAEKLKKRLKKEEKEEVLELEEMYINKKDI
jgi:hypothetical protein